MLRPAPYDVRLALRTIALAGVALAVVALVEWMTDERGIAVPGSGGRSIGLLPLTPVAGAIAIAIAIAPMVRSGEQRALAALGAPPWRIRLAPMLAATLLAMGAAIAVARGAVDVTPLFPPPSRATDWKVEAEVATGSATHTPVDAAPSFVSARRKARVDTEDVLTRTAGPDDQAEGAGLPAHAVAAASLAIAASGLALALWVGSPQRKRPLRTIVVGAIYGAGQVAAFQSAGARALPALAIVLPSLGLIAIALIEHASARRLGDEEGWI